MASRAKSRSGRSVLHSPGQQASLCLTPSASGCRCCPTSVLAAFLFQVEEMARDLTRLGRLLPPAETTSYAAFLVKRIGDRIDCIDALVQPTAAEPHRRGLAVDDALRAGDGRKNELRRLLGRRTP